MIALVVVALTGCGGSNNNSSGGGTKQQGGTAYWAELPQATPNYIFPFAQFAYFSVANLTQFQNLMYRPLYWFGKGAAPVLDLSRSLANAPSYSNGNTVVTIDLKGWKWSNGETITAQDAVFWLNMMQVEKGVWAGYVPGTLPDDVQSIKADGTTLTLTLKAPVNPNWFTYNELAQITPMPMAWNLTAAGTKGICATADFSSIKVTTDAKGNVVPVSGSAKSCADTFTYLDSDAKKISGYVGSPIWSVVDGPWTLSKMDASGNVEFVPNTKYSGPQQPTLDKFIEVPYTSDDAEFTALATDRIDVGYLPTQDITSNASAPDNDPCNLTPGQNNGRLSNYNIDAVFPWSINYFPYNMTSSANNGTAGKIFSQLYFRQAFQLLVNQPLYIKQIFKGYGVPTYGPVPVCPANDFVTDEERANTYAYNEQRAIDLLRSHGWNVKPNGTSTCSNGAKCGVPTGTPLNFTLQYASGTKATDQLMNAEKSAWGAAGINIKLTTATFDTVIGIAVPCSGSSCTWQLENWGAGWIFAPDYYPSGEVLFQTGASSNAGSYSDARADTLIKATTQGNADLSNYQNYLADQLPVVWQPNPVSVYEIKKSLSGVTPLNALLTINPEDWYFTK